jgi:phosphoglycolate phosphatase-like HAD superfamily hydrolase
VETGRDAILVGVLAVFDVDGVVADVRHRLRHVARGRKNWAAFFAAAADDPPLPVGVALAREWAAEHDLVWLTGRPEHLRRVTERWLRAHRLPVQRLEMRPADDRRPARFFKADRIRTLAAETEVAVVVDDDPEVVAELTARGWPVYLADWVPYAEALREAQERSGRT